MELLERAGRDDLDGVKRLIQEGVDVNTTNSSNQTALHCACEKGHTKLAHYLLDNGASVDLGEKPLIVSVRNNHYDCVKLLLEHNADVNCCNTDGQSPVSIALLQRNYFCYSKVLLLLQYGAIPPASLGVIAIPLLKYAEAKHAETIEKLIDAKIINLTHWRVFLTWFRFAFKRGSVELAERMVAYAETSYSTVEQLHSFAAYHSAKNNWPTLLSNLIRKEVDINRRTRGETPLYAACEEGHESVVHLLLNNGADPNVPNEDTDNFSSPLQIAVYGGKVVIVDMLLGKGANLNPHGEPLLHIIAGSGDDEWKCVGTIRSLKQRLSKSRLLLQQGVDVNALCLGTTALYDACEYERLKVVQILLEAGADVNLTSNRCYPLISACKSGNVELINLLVKAGADVKCTDEHNITCLHAFINAYLSPKNRREHSHNLSKLDIVNTVRLLLDAGVDVDACYLFDSNNDTALYRMSESGDEVIVRMLLEAGADTNSSASRNPLYAACERGYTQIVNLLLQHGADANPSSAHSNLVPIFRALRLGHTDIVYLLLKHGADVNKRDQSGKSAFMYYVQLLASRRCNTSQASNTLDERSFTMLKSMLLAGGDVNKLSEDDGCNALHIASSSGKCDVMMALIHYGANCNYLTDVGKSAFDLARERDHESAMELLLKNGAKPDSSHSSISRMLCTAAMNNRETIDKLLLKYGAAVINASAISGNTALHLATSSGIVEMLLNAGANVNATNRKGETALSVFCKNRMAAKVVEMLLKFGADPNACSALNAACKNNDLDTVRLLLTHGADANQVKSSNYMYMDLWMRTDLSLPPLCIACKYGNVAIVDCLLANGAAVTFADGDGKTPLHFTIERLVQQVSSEECDPIVTRLLQHNAAVNVVSNSGESPLYAACSRGLTGVVKQLLDYNADVDLTSSWNKYPLIIACEKNFSDIAMMLLDRGADANVCKDGQTPLKLASAHGDTVLVKQLLSLGADVNKRHSHGDTALHAAVVGCKTLANTYDYLSGIFVHKIIKMLLKNGAEANAVNNNNETPLYLACLSSDCNTDIVRTLLEHGADPNLYPRYYSRISAPLSAAAGCGNSELVLLLIMFGARLDQTDEFGRTAVHCAVEGWSKKDTSTVNTLLSAGADTNAMDTTGATPLYLACDRGMTDIVKLLLSHGASPNYGTADKYPIITACKGHQYDLAKLLLAHNADVTVRDEKGKTSLDHVLEIVSHYGSENGKRSDLVHLLLDAGADTNTASEDGKTPFYVACWNGLLSIVAKMLECGANVNGNPGKKLPLIAACRNNHTSVVQLLLTNGADPDNYEEEHDVTLPVYMAKNRFGRVKPVAFIDVRGNTALHYAVELCQRNDVAANNATSNARSMVEILLENKADVNTGNFFGVTPLYLAASLNLVDVVRKMLQQYGGNPNKGSPLVAACLVKNVELVELLLKHGASPNLTLTLATCEPNLNQQKLPMFIAVEADNNHSIISLFHGGASVNMVNHEGPNIICFVTQQLLNSGSYHSITREMSTIHLLLQHGANFNMLMPDGHSPLYLAVSALSEGDADRIMTHVVELLQLMVKHDAMLKDTVCLDSDMFRKSPRSGTLMSLTRFDDKHKFIVELLRAGAGFQVIATFCDAVATRPREAKSIRLCQAVVLAGYSPSDEELQNLQVAAAGETDEGSLVEQLLSWLIEERQQVPSLVRQCRIAIRRQLSEAVHHQTIIPAIDKLPLPKDIKLYLQFAGVITEIDLDELYPIDLEEEYSMEDSSEESDDDFPDTDYSDSDCSLDDVVRLQCA